MTSADVSLSMIKFYSDKAIRSAMMDSDNVVWMPYASAFLWLGPFKVEYNGGWIEPDGFEFLSELPKHEVRHINKVPWVNLDGLYRMALYSQREAVRHVMTKDMGQQIAQYLKNRNSEAFLDKIASLFVDPPEGNPEGTAGVIYFVQSHDRIKIGWTQNLERRLLQLQSASPRRIKLLFTLLSNFCQLAERQLHQHYANARAHGEWFALTKDQIQQARDLKDMIYDTCNLPPRSIDRWKIG